MREWRCRECGGTLRVADDDALVAAVLDHPCVPLPSWYARTVEYGPGWLKRWLTHDDARTGDDQQRAEVARE